MKRKSLSSLLKNALVPMGHTLYIYGGGWNTEDTGAAAETRTLGESPVWRAFFESQDAHYTYKNDDDPQHSFYPYDGINTHHALGLDCSGYVGWTLYNTLCDKDGQEGFVMKSTQAARLLAGRGFGTFSKERRLLSGDIVSMKGHVWICLGTCRDGSVLIAHSTPSLSRAGAPGGGVQLSALTDEKNADCEALRLADRIMREYFPDWYARYPAVCRSLAAYTRFDDPDTGIFSWDLTNGPLADPMGLRKMTAEEIVAYLFK